MEKKITDSVNLSHRYSLSYSNSLKCATPVELIELNKTKRIKTDFLFIKKRTYILYRIENENIVQKQNLANNQLIFFH